MDLHSWNPCCLRVSRARCSVRVCWESVSPENVLCHQGRSHDPEKNGGKADGEGPAVAAESWGGWRYGEKEKAHSEPRGNKAETLAGREKGTRGGQWKKQWMRSLWRWREGQKTGAAAFRTLDRMQSSYREASHSLAERKSINPSWSREQGS